MNTAPATRQTRTIRVKEFLNDFHAGTRDDDLLLKYNLTPAGLEKFFGMLLEKGILTSYELEARFDNGTAEAPAFVEAAPGKSSFMCPACLASHDEMYDICPCCGVSFEELLGGGKCASPFSGSEASIEASPSLQQAHRGPDTDLFRVPKPPAGFRDAAPAPQAAAVTAADPKKPERTASVGEAWRSDPEGFDDSLDEIVTGMPLADYETYERAPEVVEVLCESCKEPTVPALRDIFDRRRSVLALTLSAVALVGGFLGAGALSFFEGYSFARLIVVYVTAVALLFGTVLATVGAFMFLAREKVYFCSACRRVFPRG